MQSSSPRVSLLLVGPRACGKTTLGRHLAAALGLPFTDLDELIIVRAGRSIDTLVAAEGWEGFRDLESRVLAEQFEERDGPARVLATGGGAVVREANRAMIHQAKASGWRVVYLSARPEVLHARLCQDPKEAQRPALTDLDPQAEIRAVLAEREPYYTDVADLTLSAENDISSLVATVRNALNRQA